LILTAGAAFGVNPKSCIADIDARPDRFKLLVHKSRFVAYDFALEAAQRNGKSHNKGYWQAPIKSIRPHHLRQLQAARYFGEHERVSPHFVIGLYSGKNETK
jgi:hypothetical protein